MESYKQEYNNLLKRYYKGCKYLEAHREDIEKFMPELLKILNEINIMIEENNIEDEQIILNGFNM